MEMLIVVAIVVAVVLLGWAGIHIVAGIQYAVRKHRVMKKIPRNLDKTLEKE